MDFVAFLTFFSVQNLPFLIIYVSKCSCVIFIALFYMNKLKAYIIFLSFFHHNSPHGSLCSGDVKMILTFQTDYVLSWSHSYQETVACEIYFNFVQSGLTGFVISLDVISCNDILSSGTCGVFRKQHQKQIISDILSKDLMGQNCGGQLKIIATNKFYF